MKNMVIRVSGKDQLAVTRADNRLLGVWKELDELLSHLDGAERTLGVLSRQAPNCGEHDLCATVGFVRDGLHSIKDRLSVQADTVGEVARAIDNPYSKSVH